MDCKTARLLVCFARPGSAEFDADELRALENHISACSECEAVARMERAVDDAIASAMKNIPIPADLHSRLVERISRAERGRWRRTLLRHPRVAAALAASLLIACAGAFYLATRPRPVLDFPAALNQAMDQRGAVPQEVERWFRQEHGIEVLAPPNLNYAFLDSFDLNGQRLPQLIFIHGNDRARVVIVTSKQFDLDASLRQAPADSGGYRLELRTHPQRPDVAYLILYTGGSLDWLVLEEQPAA